MSNIYFDEKYKLFMHDHKYELDSNVGGSINKNTLGKNSFIRIKSIIIPVSVTMSDIISFNILLYFFVYWKIPIEIMLKKCDITLVGGYWYINFNDKLLSETSNIMEILSLDKYTDLCTMFESKKNFKYYVIVSQMHKNPLFAQLSTQNNLCYDMFQYLIMGNMNQSAYLSIINSTSFYIKTSSPLIKLEIYIDDSCYMYYDEDLIVFFDFLDYTINLNWTQYHSIALYESLGHILPNEMIYEIEKYLSNDIVYMYHIPFGIGEDESAFVNFNYAKSSKICFTTKKDSPDDKIFIKSKNKIMYMRNSKMVSHAFSIY